MHGAYLKRTLPSSILLSVTCHLPCHMHSRQTHSRRSLLGCYTFCNHIQFELSLLWWSLLRQYYSLTIALHFHLNTCGHAFNVRWMHLLEIYMVTSKHSHVFLLCGAHSGLLQLYIHKRVSNQETKTEMFVIRLDRQTNKQTNNNNNNNNKDLVSRLIPYLIVKTLIV